MTFDERVQVVAKSGITERQARFLTTVMLHAGVCVPRQYARIYHLNHRALYSAIGEAGSTLRRPLTLNHAIQRLMLLDAIVEEPEMIWLGTAEDKANHLMALTGIKPEDLPHVSVADGEWRRARYFPDCLPIGIHLTGRGVLVYVVLDPTLNDFRLFLERYSAVLRALPAWTVRVVVPPQFSDLAQRVN